MEQTLKFRVSEADAGLRLDQFLAAQVSDVSRARVQELIAQRCVTVNGGWEKPSLRLRIGDEIEIAGELQRPPVRAIAEEIPLEVVYEDDWLAVVNKPAGLLVHAGAGQSRSTLVNALLHHFKQLSGAGGELRPGIVHRLDKETSGLMVVTKTDAAHHRLAAQFAARQVKKTYLALVQGWPEREGDSIHAPISRDRARRIRMTTRAAAGREAVTHFKVLERFDSPWGKFSLLEVRIETGRTHQIRVHLASIHHPVVGDTLYGAARAMRTLPGKRAALPAPAALTRNFLHAARLEFQHPATGRKMSFSTPLPAELDRFLEQLRAPR